MSKPDTDHLAQAARDLAVAANRLAWALEPNGAEAVHAWSGDEPEPIVPEYARTAEAPEPSDPTPSTPGFAQAGALDKVTVEWDTLRLVVSSKLSKLMADKVYVPRNTTDKGYAWLAEQIGVGGNAVRKFLSEPDRTMYPEAFVRMCLWTGYPITDFISMGEDQDD